MLWMCVYGYVHFVVVICTKILVMGDESNWFLCLLLYIYITLCLAASCEFVGQTFSALVND